MSSNHGSVPDLSGKVALVTGAAVRVGAAIVEALHSAGANVAIHYRKSSDDAIRLRDALNERRPDSTETVQADLDRTDQFPGLIERITDGQGRLDILVNNASSFYPTPVGQITEAAWNDLLSSNLKAPLFLSQAAAAPLRTAGGLIVNIVDIYSQQPLKNHPVYCAAKAGLAMLTKSLAKELGPEIRVNGVSPGPVLWPPGLDEDTKNQIVNRTALKRAGSPEDVAGAVLYFAGAGFVTGQIVAVDGGRSIGW